jgi:NAD(P)-dependent dehydrogenase (short-subunit alcohol dehydrogenase family)
LTGKVAVVTGATYGVGRGIAAELAAQGACVFSTGRSIQSDAGSGGSGIRCDHCVDERVAAAFEQVLGQAGDVDILVNNVWGGYERMVEDGLFTWTKPFSGSSRSGVGTRCARQASAHTTMPASLPRDRRRHARVG